MKIFITIGLVLWLSVIGCGIVYMGRYEAAAGPKPISPPEKFPITGSIRQEKNRSTLIFFAHPKCPCSRAGVNELARLMPEVQDRLTVYVVLSKPPGAPEEWADTDLRTSAEAVPGVRVVIDEKETGADLFGARTSGTALLYDPDGNLRFQGGITRSRGMEGDNAGRSAIAALVNSNFSEYSETPIYGCPIRDLPDNQSIR